MTSPGLANRERKGCQRKKAGAILSLRLIFVQYRRRFAMAFFPAWHPLGAFSRDNWTSPTNVQIFIWR
jgi:hypothetical protein